MDIPKSCSECPMCHPKGKDEPWNFACFQGMMDINIDEWDEKRHPNCPIKCGIEDIKAEFEPIAERAEDRMEYGCRVFSVDQINEIIDKHIKDGEEKTANRR